MSDTEIHSAFTVVDDEDTSPRTAPPLWKQLLGAVVGALIALVLYGVYQMAEPLVTAMVSPAPTDHHDAVSASHRTQRPQ